MDRRQFLVTAASAPFVGCAAERPLAPVGRPAPRPAQLAWQEAELGIVFHYDLHVFDERRYVQHDNRRRPPLPASAFDPPRLDADQWVDAAVRAGATFAILTASHETGFRLWPSRANPFSVKNSPWRGGRGDVVGEFVAACRRRGIRPGIYLGTRWNARLQVLDSRVTASSPLKQAAYNELVAREVEEICSDYGPLFELWFDGGVLAPQLGGPDVLPRFEQLQPDCLFYHSDERADARWGGTESGTVGAPCWSTLDLDAVRNGSWDARKRDLLRHGDPAGRDWCPAMADAPIRNHEWFWEPDDEHKLYSVEALVAMYFDSVGRNSTLILGGVVDREGRVPSADVARLAAFGEAVRARLGASVAATSGRGRSLQLTLPDDASFDLVVLQEDVRAGERVRRFRVQVGDGGDGSGWRELCRGQCIGHKFLARVPRTRAQRLRLVVDDAVDEPVLRRVEARSS